MFLLIVVKVRNLTDWIALKFLRTEYFATIPLKHVIINFRNRFAKMKFETFFRSVSYAAVLCGFLALWVSGTFGIIGTSVFIGIMIAAWFLEGSRWQISERVGTALIVLALPAYYLAFRFQLISFAGSEAVIVGILASMILSLSAIKLLQRKADRDWIFLYLMAFFEVLLAAGLSISALYLATFLVYLLVMVCAIIAYEIRKTSREVDHKIAAAELSKHDIINKPSFTLKIRKLPVTAFVLIAFIIVLATPLFFMLPRVGGAGLGGNQGKLGTQSGFSDKVRLGGFGRITENDSVVMRVRMENKADNFTDMYFRGVALDTFDDQTWTRSKQNSKEPFIKRNSDVIRVDTPSGREELTMQTIYLEPLDTSVLFAMPRAIAFQGSFSILTKDTYGAVSNQWSTERSSYRAFSDRSMPPVERLRQDDQAYGDESRNYLQVPLNEDRRIFDLAYSIASKHSNRYDKSKAIEEFLQTNYGYTLEQKAGGDQPLSDFLFNVREGHCEYFATAMAIMLRTQGIATRIVNGFHGGEYNDAADMVLVRQRHAHSWVEAYFPKENTWVTFDPTPATAGAATGVAGSFSEMISKYIEALDAIWIQYFVAFDNQEQGTLARSVKNSFADYQDKTSSYLGHLQDIAAEWWSEVRGDSGQTARALAIGYAIAGAAGLIVFFLLLRLLVRKIFSLTIWGSLRQLMFAKPHTSIIEFYDRMQKMLAEKGFIREPYQTPLEFAYSIGMPEAVAITKKYNGVRFGEQDVSRVEADEIETLLERLKANSDKI